MVKLCEFNADSKFKLVYKASIDGFAAKSFHEKCDLIKNTLTIIKTTDNYIFGGYTRQNWSGNEIGKIDPHAFIFSLKNKNKSRFKINCQSGDDAIGCFPKV